ncbi:MAG: invasin domain 3-containing protein, partial [Desulfatibacillaceae bacterium]|nr:invasin domain 3-containing protein [Desulfatibacillaceae bacterium]
MKRYEGILMKTGKARFALFLLLGFTLLLAGACGPGGGAEDPAPSPAPAPVGPGAAAQIDLLASRATITTDDVSTSTITAVVKDAKGNVVNQGTRVDFAAQGPAGAYDAIAPRSAQTDDQGRASAVLTALSSAAAGNYTVTARSGVVQASGVVQFTASQVASVALSTGGTTSIVANGTSTLRLDVTAVNSAGTPMPEGTAVTFTTTQGFFADSLAPGGFAATTEVAISGSGGVASVLLYSSTNLGTAIVTASVGTPPGDRNTSVAVEFISGPAAQIFVSALPANLPADGASTSNIRVTVLDAWGNPVADGASVVLSLAQGSGTLSTLSTQTSGGLATAVFTAPSSVPAVNPVTITAKAGNAPDATTNINLTGPQISGISLSANPPSLPADGASTAFVSATVSVTGGGTAPDGTEVSFSIVEGAGVITQNHTTAGGVATAILTASSQEGTATIRAQAGGRQAEMEIEYKPGKVEVTATPNTVLGTGRETSSVVAQVSQANGLPVTNTLIVFSLSNADMGSLSPTSALSDDTGKARTTFTAAKSGGTVVVTGTWTMQSGTQVRGSANIFVQAAPAIINVAEGYPAPTAVSVRGQGGETTSVIVFEVRDAQNQPVADGYRINFSIQTGPNGGESLVPNFAFTQSGQVSTTLRSGFKSGPVSIKATYHNDTQVTVTTSSLAIGNGPPVGEAFGLYSYYRNLSGLNPQSVNLQTTVLATVADVVGNAVPDNTAIAFKTYNTGGKFPNPASAPTMDGNATILFTAMPPPNPIGGFVSLTAEATDGGRTTRVTSISVDPMSLIDPASITLYAATNGGGVYKST